MKMTRVTCDLVLNFFMMCRDDELHAPMHAGPTKASNAMRRSTQDYLSINAILIIEQRQLLCPKALDLHSRVLHRLSILSSELKLDRHGLAKISEPLLQEPIS